MTNNVQLSSGEQTQAQKACVLVSTYLSKWRLFAVFDTSVWKSSLSLKTQSVLSIALCISSCLTPDVKPDM